MDKICATPGCYERAKYYSYKFDWFCEAHKPEKLFLWDNDIRVLNALTNQELSIHGISKTLNMDDANVSESIARLEHNKLVKMLPKFLEMYSQDGGIFHIALYKRTDALPVKTDCCDGCNGCYGNDTKKKFHVDVTLSECQIRALHGNVNVIGDGMRGQVIHQIFSQVQNILNDIKDTATVDLIDIIKNCESMIIPDEQIKRMDAPYTKYAEMFNSNLKDAIFYYSAIIKEREENENV